MYDAKNGVGRGKKIGAVSLELLRHSPFAVLLVGVRGFELPTSTSRTWRANQLRYTPNPLLLSGAKLIFFFFICNMIITDKADLIHYNPISTHFK